MFTRFVMRMDNDNGMHYWNLIVEVLQLACISYTIANDFLLIRRLMTKQYGIKTFKVKFGISNGKLMVS